jgi:hypothetical protein
MIDNIASITSESNGLKLVEMAHHCRAAVGSSDQSYPPRFFDVATPESCDELFLDLMFRRTPLDGFL